MVIEESVPQDNCPPDYFFRKITPKIIAPWQYPPGNCPRGKLSFGWFVAYIFTPRTIGPEKTAPLPLRKIVPRINYTRDIFSPRIRNLSNLIDSYFLLFSFFVVKISTRRWLLYNINFYKRRDWNCLKKKNKSRTNWAWNNEAGLFMLSQQIETDKVYHRKAHEILFKKK